MKEVQYDVIIEAFKVLFNHYLPNSKQVELFKDLQTLVNSIGGSTGGFSGGLKKDQLLTEEQIEQKIVKGFQMMYPHYYNLNIIARITN